ncbi:SulP family inorganic anion transporter [Pseudonocardia petroleophila]|uniref:carbonic anhydrase n=1 Tax=Pseudonocardia petroleophila TaxID=37331 RepID=A0A7G7MG60_9PSEU|nr:SulP family inorganic anion transporter [Pseudonocardia petroleophila]QNG51771.1 bifunctional SulP family inorganic anion transporter/carbonic anhydrase [Pseudonocardia petroleophila]
MTASDVRPAQHAPPPPAPPGRLAALRADVGASLVVFLVAVPLSLGIALASGAPIMAGIIAAVVGGVVAGLLGGSPLQVSGPAAGLTVVVAELVARFGWQVTCLITVGAGLLQIVFGLLRVARFSQAIPPAVVHGMLAGIGLTIVLGQLHVVLGGTPPSGAVESLLGLPARLLAADPAAAAVGGVTITMLLAWPLVPKAVRAVPGPLVAVVAATAVAVIWPAVPRVDLPGGLLESIALPSVLPTGDWAGIAGGILTVALIASVESLLSAVAVDRMRRPDGSQGPRTRPDRELIGQGAANGVSGLLGGLPVTGVIVRSSANVRAGARTRASTVLHGVWIAVFAIALIGIIELVPLAALAGLLIMVGLQLVKPVDVTQARRHGDLAVYLATIAGVLALNLLEGVGVGLAVAGFLMLRRALSANLQHEPPAAEGEPHRVVVGGTLSFLSVPALARTLGAVPPGAPVQVDLVVDYLDHAAYDHLDTWTTRHRASGAPTEVTEPPGAGGARRGRYATWSQWQGSEANPLLAGVAAFHEESAALRPTLRSLGSGQAPAGLLLTCADSRVVPSVITRSGPGDLFTVQNVGNLVAGTSARAAVQYATTVLRVPTLAVCGHSGCGAMRGLLDGTAEGALGDWLRAATPSLEAFRSGHPVGAAALRDGFGEAEALAMVNVAVQLDALEHTGADLVGLFFDIPTARVLTLDREAREFRH